MTKKERNEKEPRIGHVTKGNVFKDIGFTDTEAAILAMRVDIAVELEKFIKRKKMTQAQAAAYFGVTQPRISNILKKNLDGFTIDFLVRMIGKAGKNPRVTFRNSRAAA